VLELERANECTIQDHSKNCAPCHLPNLDPTIITSTWSPHLTIHVRYVRGQTMLIKCCFAIIVMVDTSILPQTRAHSSSCRHLVLFIMFSYNTLIFTQTMPCFSRLKSGGGYTKISSQPLLVHCIYMCMHLFLVNSFYLWLVFLFNGVYYGFTPLQHRMSWHYMSWQLSCSYAWPHTWQPITSMPIMPLGLM